MASVKTTIEACTSVYYGESHLEYRCKRDMGYMICQIVLYTLAVMCALTEVEHIIMRREGRRAKV